MTIGIVLGNFVPKTGPALQKGKFVGVSVPVVCTWSNATNSADPAKRPVCWLWCIRSCARSASKRCISPSAKESSGSR